MLPKRNRVRTQATVVAAIVLLAACRIALAAAQINSVVEQAATVPTAYDADVLVIGGSLAGVEAACAAAKKGADVVLIEDRAYLGYDLCATQRLWLETDEKPATPLTRSIFGSGAVAAPMRVKAALDKAILEAGVQFLTGCYGVDVLAAESGQPAGVVMINRSGRQVIRAKVIIDATDHASLTGLAGAAFRPAAKEPEELKYVVVGGRPVDGTTHRKLHVSYTSQNIEYPVYEYSLKTKRSGSGSGSGFRPLNDIFHKARSLTWTDAAADVSERLFHIPHNSIVSSVTADGNWPGADRVELGLFRPAKVKNWYVLSAYSDLPRKHMARALRPPQWAVIGQRVGRAADQAEGTKSGMVFGEYMPGRHADASSRPKSQAAVIPEQRVSRGRSDAYLVTQCFSVWKLFTET